MSAALQQRYHPSYLHTADIVLYFMFRIESSDHEEQRLFISTFCEHFIHRVDKHLQNTSSSSSTPSIPSIQNGKNGLSNQSTSSDRKLKNGNSHSPSYLLNKTKDVFFEDEDVYNVIRYAPFHLVLSLFIPHILQSRFMCPLKLIQSRFSNLIAYINQKLQCRLPYSVPPYSLSGFLELKYIKCPYQSQDEIDSESNDHWFGCYGKFGRITHLNVLLNVEGHREYCNDLNKLVHCLMFESNGPLARARRQYLGLMAASRYGCSPLINQCEMQFAKLSGDPSWIKSGITSAPHKYQKLAKLNALLAHTPWVIDANHIAELVKGDGAWTISELVQSLVILVQYHYFAAMYQGLCVTPEVDQYFASRLAQELKADSDKDPLQSVLEIFQSPTATELNVADINVIDKKNQITNISNKKGGDASLSTQLSSVTLDVVSNENVNESGQDHDAKDSDPDDVEDELDEDEKEENRRCQTIATLLKHQQDLLKNEDVVGSSNTGFEESACLNRELDSVSENISANGLSLKFRQISSSVEEDGHSLSRSGSMECDPEMAPPTSSKILIDAQKKEDIESQLNEHKEIAPSSSSSIRPSALPKVNQMTATHWKQLIFLRKKGMIPQSSSETQKGKALRKKLHRVKSDDSDIPNDSDKDKGNGNGNGNESKESPMGKTKGKGKKRKYKGIVAPQSGGTEYWRYSLDVNMVYTDFDVHSPYKMYSCDFNWEHHGYSCLSRYYPGIEKKVDAVFRKAATMTDGSINSIEADTEKFRSAIRHYTFVLYGVNNDAYEYRYVNIFLPIELKVFIKKLACWPQSVTIDNVRHMGVKLEEREKIHIAILVLEAKKEAALLFALRAVKRYMQSN